MRRGHPLRRCRRLGSRPASLLCRQRRRNAHHIGRRAPCRRPALRPYIIDRHDRGARGEVAREDTPHRGTFLREYERTKYLGEELVRKAVNEGFDAVVTNPTGIIGPRGFGITGQVLIAYLRRKLPTLPSPDNRVNLVHAADVADGTIAALERGRCGERYILGSDNVTIAEMFRCCERITGVEPPTRRLPRWVEYGLAAIIELAGRVSGRRPPLSRDILRVARHGVIADSTKANRELGYSPRPVEDALRDTLEWYLDAGHGRGAI